jgi:transposase InsO family protein
LGVSTVRRMLARPRPKPSPTVTPKRARDQTDKAKRTVIARHPSHVWNVDLTTVPTRAGFWVPWIPLTLTQRWPFAWWVVGIIDHFSRVVIGFAVFRSPPSAEEISAVLDRAVANVGKAPRYMVSDQGAQFQKLYRATCAKHNIKPRYGAIGRHGSIAVIERFFRTLKSEMLRRILLPFDVLEMRKAVARYVSWYNMLRPHRSLGGATPIEIHFKMRPTNRAPRFEPRARYPTKGVCAAPKARVFGKPGVRLEMLVQGFEGGDPGIMPVIELNRAA